MIKSEKTYYKQIFYFAMAVLAVTFLLVLVLTNGYSARGLLYSSGNQIFSDFFNSMLYNIDNPYENYVFYPPFANMLYKALLRLVPDSVISTYVVSTDTTSFEPEIKAYQGFMFPFIIYSIITIAFLLLALLTTKKGTKTEKYGFTILILFSAPMLFMFERANNIVVVLTCLLFFINMHDSESRIKRETSLVLLAVATAIKIYPALFCAILLRKKRIADIFKVAGYTLVLTLVPLFVFYDGFGAIELLFKNLSSYGTNTGLQIGTQLNFAKCIIFPLFGTGLSNETLLLIGEIFKYVITVIASIAAIFNKKPWQQAALCCCIIYGFQGTCATYLLTLFVVPLIMFIDGEKEKSLFNYIMLAIMIILQGLIISIMPTTGEFTRMIGTKITSYAILLMTIMLSWRGVCDCMEVLKKIGKKQKN